MGTIPLHLEASATKAGSIREVIKATMDETFSGSGLVPGRYQKMKHGGALHATLYHLELLVNKDATLNPDQAKILGEFLFSMHDDGRQPSSEFVISLATYINSCRTDD